MANPFEIRFVDPVLGALNVERELSTLASQRAMRSESELRQQEAGLRLAELTADAPLREAERQRLLALARDTGEAGGGRLPGSDFNIDVTPGGLPSWLIGRESGGNFAARNTDTGASGRGQFMASRLADAKRAGVIPESMTLEQFRSDPVAQTRVEQWHVADIGNFIANNNLSQYVGQTIAGIPVTPNGMLAVAHLGGAGGLKKFLETGGRYNPPDANGTRLSDYLRLGAQASGTQFTTGAAQPQGPQQPAQPAPMMTLAPGLRTAGQPQSQAMPSMMFAPGAGVTLSPGGVPYTIPDGDLPAVGAAESQAVFQVPGPNGMQAVTMPQGGAPTPAAPAPTLGAPQVGTDVERARAARTAVEEQRQREKLVLDAQTAVYQSPQGQAAVQMMEQGRLRGDREMYQRGQAELVRLTDAMYAQLSAAGLPVPEAGPAAAAPGAAPQPTSAVPFTPTTGEAISQLPAATNLTALGITPIGRGAPAPQPAQPPAAQTVGGVPLATSIPGVTVAGPALLGLQQVREQRAQLQRDYDRIRLAPPAERAAMRSRIEAANIALTAQEKNYQADIAVGQLSMGQWQPLNNIVGQVYKGASIRPVESNGRVVAYDFVTREGQTSRLTPDALGSTMRLALSQTFAKQQADLNKSFYETQLEMLKDVAKKRADTAGKIAEIEATARTQGFKNVQKVADPRGGEAVIFQNPATGQMYRFRTVPVEGKKGETRDEITLINTSVPVE